MNPILRHPTICAASVAALHLAVLAAAIVGGFLPQTRGGDSSAGVSVNPDKTLYTCGMHPQVIQDHPGNCPICGMKLTPIRKQGNASAASTIAVDSTTVQNMNLRTGTVQRGPLR